MYTDGYNRYGKDLTNIMYNSNNIKYIMETTKTAIYIITKKKIINQSITQIYKYINDEINYLIYHRNRLTQGKIHTLWKYSYEKKFRTNKINEDNEINPLKTLNDIKLYLNIRIIKKMTKKIISSINQLYRYNEIVNDPVIEKIKKINPILDYPKKFRHSPTYVHIKKFHRKSIRSK